MRTDDIADVKRTLWSAADEVRANSRLTPAEFRGPALGLIFLAYAEQRFEAEIKLGPYLPEVDSRYSGPGFGPYATIFGRAELIEGDPDRVREESWPILLKYLHEDEAVVRWARINRDQDRVVFLVHPDKVIWRNSVR